MKQVEPNGKMVKSMYNVWNKLNLMGKRLNPCIMF